MARAPLSVAIIGAGMGGLAAAAALRRVGIAVTIYEQARQFTRIGAGIQMTPNAMKVLRRLGLEDHLRNIAFEPPEGLNRVWDTGEITNVLPMGRAIEARYGAPMLMMHRGDLHAALASLVPSEIIALDRKLVGIEEARGQAVLFFADGSSVAADAAIGADGVHSTVREILLGREAPRFTGRVAYRTTFPTALISDATIDDRCKWWGPDRHIVIYYVRRNREEIYFVTSTPEPDFNIESWSQKGDLTRLRAAYEGFHPQVQAVLRACPEVHKWALVDRDPLPRWGEGRIVLLGDACHPMTPYMAQGAATAIEDAAVLSRCLVGVDADGVAEALARYAASRRERTARIQLNARENNWMRYKTDPDWVYGYDAWEAPLAETAVV